MSTELATAPKREVQLASGSEGIATAIAQLKSLRAFVGQEMKEGVDFGTIPGTNKPTLYLPGAQKTALYFNCTARFQWCDDDIGPPLSGHLESVVTCRLHLRGSDAIVAEGTGSASTMESKYRYRKGERTCPVCGAATIIKGKAEYGGGWLCFAKKGGCGAKFDDRDESITGQATGRVENPDIWDIRNTVRKMAAKRAQVAAALNLGAMAELFTQDMEDFAHGVEEIQPEAPPKSNPKPGKREPRPAANHDDGNAEDWFDRMARDISRHYRVEHERAGLGDWPVVNRFEVVGSLVNLLIERDTINEDGISRPDGKRDQGRMLAAARHAVAEWPEWCDTEIRARYRAKCKALISNDGKPAEAAPDPSAPWEPGADG